MKLIFSAFAFVLAFVTSSQATTTITFDHNLSTDPYVYNQYTGTSQGFNYDYNTAYLGGNYVYLHDDSGITSSTVRAVNGSRFTASSVDISGYSQMFRSGTGPMQDFSDPTYWQWAVAGIAPVPMLTFSGIRNGLTVATQSFGPTFLGGPATWDSVNLTSAFTAIDQLLMSVNIPPYANRFYPTQSNQVWCQQWCAGFQVDNLSVSPVPLPATGWLVISALFALGWLRRFT